MNLFLYAYLHPMRYPVEGFDYTGNTTLIKLIIYYDFT